MRVCEQCGESFVGSACSCGGHARQEAPPAIRSTYVERPFGLTREEFGTDLFDAIQAQAGSIQAFKTADLYRKKKLKRQAEAYQKTGKQLQKELEVILQKNTIEPGDLRRILAMQ